MKTKKERIKAANKRRGDWTYEDEEFTREDWRYDVANKDTQLGYFDWVKHNVGG